MAELVLVIGLPGSGKSTWVQKKYDYDRIFHHNTIILSSDRVRKELFNDENDQSHNEEVFQYIKETAVKGLLQDRRVVIDATNITRKSRASITDYVEQHISGFYEHGLISFIVIATPYYKCLENNSNRSRQVPEEVIKRMYKNFEFPTFTETVHLIDFVYPFDLDDKYLCNHPYENLMDFPHDTPYHKLTVGEHMKETLKIMKTLTDDKIMLKTAELHDIGKPFCKEFLEDGSRARYLNHANVGSYEAMFYAKANKFTAREIIDLCNLIQFHMRLYDCAENEKATKKLKNQLPDELYYKLKLLKIADEEAH